ncbi:MAG: hypothetical protein K2X47_19495 [Bdellovibrionales bacterium]|nr:hypothetical protein [Bdellovibrionales bacterium]
MIQARRPNSHHKDSVELPKALLDLVAESLLEEFGEDLPPKLVVSGRIFKEEILVRVGWPIGEGGLRYMNVEASIDFDSKTQDVNERINICLDALQGSLEEFIDAEGDIEVPRFWNEFTFEKQKVYIQFSPVNPKLEDQADAFLKEHGFLEDGSQEALEEAAAAAAKDSAENLTTTATRNLKAIAAEIQAHALKISAPIVDGSPTSKDDFSPGDLAIDPENPFESPLLKKMRRDLALQSTSKKSH